ncbi:hypothetical protein F442_08885 [Phytophthora nicotianae P10297]|uniref:Uncharacterized protein n=2 Tax=Phytophthora nicotianae TaxID=4792 RepID=W2ZB66_PHYNI|nr:hypothetical protein L915_08781 [Phytophthora nicotianae]ETL40006.1 hypothetical protein L916_08710 [Phytophthora nicotianae]ETL93140.1 hypothetical protein L917_08626 [Phytophthora nicotianae]ETP44513.1 hypothetical protein F442_08885 [Phytophthora nicotianae P10297]
MSRTSKRPHEGASDASRISPKRVTRKNERLKGAIFPVRDAALPHVMQLIDRCLMGSNPAIMDAALTADVS